ncbi:DUF2867 domain-containing protein [Limnohabitans sp.]|uniref:DUF2867 domain-containing protein n=1 Tax=Limnohabitans sp. TaxID=1907725 RepID=UPI0037BE502F
MWARSRASRPKHRACESWDAKLQRRVGCAVLTVSTVVHMHNVLGRLNMLPVAPVHKLIVPSVMRVLGPMRPTWPEAIECCRFAMPVVGIVLPL